MKEQELLFTDVCTLKHSYVPKSSLRVSSLWCKCFMNRNARWLSAITDERRKHTHTHTRVVQLCTDAHTQYHICISQQQKRKSSREYRFYRLWPRGGGRIFQYLSMSNNYQHNRVNRRITPTKTSLSV